MQKGIKKANIYILCPDSDIPCGGIKQLYRLTDILNKYNFSAFILHEQKNFRCKWFVNNTKVTSRNEVQIKPSDYLVIPEIYGPNIVNMYKGVKKVIFNQNAYYTFKRYSLDKNELTTPYLDGEIIATLVASEDAKNYLQYVFPNLNIFRIHYGIDFNLFSYRALNLKKRQMAFMTRKNLKDVLQVLNILKFRGLLKKYNVVVMDNKKELEVTKILKESLIFLSFGYPEGFGLPPAEAMACGCIVIGYHGMGGKEYFKPEFSYPIPQGDIINFAKTTEEVINIYENNPDILKEKTKKASQYIQNNYPLEKEEKEIIEFWKSILSRPRYIYRKGDSVINDFSEFSNIPVEEIKNRIDNHKQLSKAEWQAILGNFARRAKHFYNISKYYIYDLLHTNYNKEAIINKLNSFSPKIIDFIKNHKGKKFLEFGGGIGLFCEIVASFGKKVTYLDLKGQVFDFAKWRFEKYHIPVDMLCSNPDKLELPENYDIIFSDAVIEHLVNPSTVVDYLCKHLNPKGLLILLIDLSREDKNRPMHKNVDVIQIHNIIKDNGLTNVLGKNSFCSIWQKPN